MFSLADRIYVLREGKKVHCCNKTETTMEEIVKLITGAKIL